MKPSTRSCCLLFVPLVIAAWGCGETRPTVERYQVTGAVTLNGEMVRQGEILFTSPTDVAEGTEASSLIQDGKYDLMATAGEKQVRIYASQLVGKDRQGMNKIVERIPAKYNRNTTLTVVVPQEDHTADFPLNVDPERRRKKQK